MLACGVALYFADIPYWVVHRKNLFSEVVA